MNKLYSILALPFLFCVTTLADTPPQVINKLCTANQFFSQIQPGPGNINCTQPTYSGILNTPSFADSVTISSNIVTLLNDVLNPGNSKLYGTNSSGVRGWYTISTDVNTIGTIDTGSPSANGASISGNSIFMQSASTSNPGLVNNSSQSFSGNKTLTGTIGASNLSGTNTGDVTIGTANGLSLAGGTQILSLGTSSALTTGALLSGDFITFAAKQDAGNYITALTGEASAAGPGSAATTLSNAAVIAKVLTGYTSGAGTVSAADSILSAIQKLNGNTAAIVGNAITSLNTDVVATGPGAAAATIQTNVVSNSKLAQMATHTIKGNSTAGTANASDLTTAQVNTLLGDLLADGSVALSADWNAGAHKITANSVQLGSAANTIAAVSTLVNGAGTLTLPSSTDTLVGRATTDTLTNKSISGSTNTLSSIADGSLSTSYLKADGTRALTGNWAAGAFSGTFNSVAVGSAANTISGLATIVNGAGTLTLPTTTDTIVGRATTDTLTNKSISGGTNTFSSIPNSATTATSANTNSAIVARDGSGNFSAGTITASLTGLASLNLPLTGGTLSGALLGTSGQFSGKFGVGTTALDTAALLSIDDAANQSLLSTSVQIGAFSGIAGASTAVTSVEGYRSAPATKAASFTTATMAGFYSTTFTKGAGSTITRAIDFLGDNQTVGTNNALLADNIGFTGSYSIHTTSTNPSVMAGRINAGSTSDNGGALVVAGEGSNGGLTGVNQIAFAARMRSSSDATGTIDAFGTYATFGTAASAFTANQMVGFRANTFSLGAGSAVTTAADFLGTPQTLATNNASFADNMNFSGSWALSLTSTNPSQMNGRFGIGAAPDTLSILGIKGNPLTGTTQIGAYANFTFTTAATGDSYGFLTNLNTAASGTMATLDEFASGSLTANGATITRLAQFFALPKTTGTNNAVFTDNHAYTGNWFINSTSTRNSTLGGSLYVNSTTPVIFSAGNVEQIASQSTSSSNSFAVAAGAFLTAPSNTTTAAAHTQLTLNAQFSRTTTANVNDSTFPTHAMQAAMVFTPSTATTYTSTAATSDFSALNIASLSNSGAGTLAISRYAGISIASDSTGGIASKTGLYIAGMTGGTNNAAISDNSGFSGSWGLNFTGSTQNSLNGSFFVPGHGTTGSAANAFLDSVTGALLRSTSSKRYKENIQDISKDIDTSKVLDLRPVTFIEKANKSKHIGLIAEEVNEVLPQLVEFIPEKMVVKGSKSSKLIPESVQYSMISVLLLQEVKKLRAEVNELKKLNVGDVIVVPLKKKGAK